MSCTRIKGVLGLAMNNNLRTLTDFEIDGLHNNFCLADGHAYQDLHPDFGKIINNLPQIWSEAAEQSIPEAERLFNHAYATFIGSSLLKDYKHFRICPTASNSIDLIGAVLKYLALPAVLIEPTFDNLALLVRRRGVSLTAIADKVFIDVAEAGQIAERLPHLQYIGALFIVHPNNPTGLTLSAAGFQNIIQFCKKHQIIMVIDNCFRVYRRELFDDYQMLIDSGVSFIAFEDTGKVWPTQDLKASLIYFSEDLGGIFNEIYNEVYLCVSNFTLRVLANFFEQTRVTGLKKTTWDLVDKRREIIRKVITGSSISVPQVSLESKLPVEWLQYNDTDKDDLDLCLEFKKHHLAVLPGRQFYWNSSHKAVNQKYIRLSLMKREAVFLKGVNILDHCCKRLIPATCG